MSEVTPVRGPRPRWVRWLLAVAAVLLCVLTIALAVGSEQLARLDQTVADWGYHSTWGHAGRSSFWVAVATYGQPMVLRAVLVLLALVLLPLLLARKRNWCLAAWLVAVTVTENVIAPSTKLLLSRPRPEWLEPIAVEQSLSYPSGHAAMAGTFAAAVILVALAMMGPGWSRRLVVLLALLVYLVISVDRIFLGVHYLSDVVAGNLLGLCIALAGWLLLLRVTSSGSGW